MPKRSRHILFPEAQSPFLTQVLESFRKRAKALRHEGNDISVQRVIERDGEEDIEKIEIQLKSSLGPQVAISVWSDRWIFVHAGHLTKRGWLWEWAKEGRFLGPEKERAISLNSEKMLSAGIGTGAPVQFCEGLWKSTIATGPSVLSLGANSVIKQTS